MKTKITALVLLTASTLSLAPKPAAASDKGLAIAGGFLGGLIVASAIHDSHYDNCAPERTTVIVDDRRDNCEPAGCWREVSVRVWVPGCWIVERGYRGDRRRYVDGHYESRNNRVWVAYDRHHEREVSYGYGHRR